MVIDMRYHVASLAAVFIALGIGILLGSVMNGDDVLARQQQRLIAVLENDVQKMVVQRENLLSQISQFKTDWAVTQQFIDTISPRIIGNALSSKCIAVVFVGCGTDRSLVKQIDAIISEAGGTLGPVMSFGKDLNSAIDSQALYSLFGLVGKAEETEYLRLVREVGRAIGGSASMNLVSHMIDAGVLTLYNDEVALPDMAIIIANANSSRQYFDQRLDLSLIEGLRDCGVRVVGAETSGADQSCLESYMRLGISTIDNVDSHIGRLALVVVLSGVDGNFGVRKTAGSLFPNTLSTREDARSTG
jgi:hypothetical protein